MYRRFFARDFKINILPAPTTSIQTNFNANTIFCAGTTIDVPITVSGISIPNPRYIVEISDNLGSFLNKTTIQTNSNSSPLSVLIPNDLPFGINYKMKVKIDGVTINSPSSNIFKVYSKPKVTIIDSLEIIPNGQDFRFRVKFEGGEPATYAYTLDFGFYTILDLEDNRVITTPSASRNFQVTSVSNICGSGDPSNSISVILDPNACVSRNDDFFIPIANVTLTDSATNQEILNNTSGVLETGYQMYNSPLKLKRDNTYIFNLTAASCIFLGSPTAITPQDVSIWIDFNNDNVFSQNELLFSNPQGQYMSTTIESKFKIPKNTNLALRRLRIRTSDYRDGLYQNPCGVGTYSGETEDYWINIDEEVCPDIRNTIEIFDNQQLSLKAKGVLIQIQLLRMAGISFLIVQHL